MFRNSTFIFIVNCICLFATVFCQEPTCRLKGIPEDTTQYNRYRLPRVSDSLEPGIQTWLCEFEGYVVKTTSNPSSDHNYMTARGGSGSKYYEVFSNEKTKLFTLEKKKRIMTRYITVYCEDGSTINYFFETPVQDMSPPGFEESEYNFKISTDWDRSTPISRGQFVIVSDNDYELGTGSRHLSFEASIDGIIDVEAHPLWSEVDQERYYYRLDIFIQEDTVLPPPGENIQLMLSAKDEFNTGLTTITINVE